MPRRTLAEFGEELRIATYDAIDLVREHLLIFLWAVALGTFAMLRLLDQLQQNPIVLLRRS